MTSDEATWKRRLEHAFPKTCIEHTSGAHPRHLSLNRVADVGVADITSAFESVVVPPTPPTPKVVSVLVQMEGEVQVAQGANRCILQPGQLALVDASAQIRLAFNGHYRQIFTLVPLARFGSVPPECRARTMDGSHVVDRLLFDFVRALPDTASQVSAEQQTHLVDAMLPMMRVISLFSEGARPAGSAAVRLERAMRYIEQNLGDPDLKPTTVASSQGVSRRFLDAQFRASGSTIDRWIWQRRLARAKALLSNDSQAATRIIDIALECGFQNHAHFSRAFRSRFGVSPSRWRREHRAALESQDGSRAT